MLERHGMKQNKIIKIGLTGTIGSGKSTVSSFLRENGFDVVDADIISREILNKYKEINERIRSEFGEDCFEDEKLNRKKFNIFIAILIPLLIILTITTTFLIQNLISSLDTRSRKLKRSILILNTYLLWAMTEQR